MQESSGEITEPKQKNAGEVDNFFGNNSNSNTDKNTNSNIDSNTNNESKVT